MQNYKISSILRTAELIVTQFIMFLIAFSISIVSSRAVGHFLSTKDSNGILNAYLPSYNPSENILKILWVLFFTIAFYMILKKLFSIKPRAFRYIFITIMVLSVFSVQLIPDATKYFGNLDTFHHGEQLSPANAFLNGKNPLTQMYVLHGVGEDVIMPSIALSLSGRDYGIGSYYFTVATLNLVSVVLFLILLSNLFRRDSIFMLVTIWFVFGSGLLFWYTRDIFVWSSLLIVYYLLTNEKLSRRKIGLLSAALGLLASGALLYSFDRGVVCSVIMFVYFALRIVSIRYSHKTNRYHLNVRLARDNIKQLLIGVSGFLLPFLVLSLAAGLSGLVAFIKTYLINIPHNQGFMFNYPLPNNINSSNLWLWAPIVLGALTGYLLVVMYRYRAKATGRNTFALILISASIVFYQLGYGRYDRGHIMYAMPLIYLSALYVLSISVNELKNLRKSIAAQFSREILMPVILILAIFAGHFFANAQNTYYAFSSISPGVVRDYIALPARPNSYWEPAQVKKVTAYINKNSNPKDSIFVFTQQPIYYYLTNRNNPTRYYITWFADSRKQEDELLNSLKHNPPVLVVYGAGNGWDTPDGYPMSARTPKVNNWLLNNYREATNIDGVVILKRR